MGKFIKSIYVIGFIFWLSFLTHALFRMVAYNGIGNHFKFICENVENYNVQEEANGILNITYSYEVVGKVYTSEERISNDLFENSGYDTGSALQICYNSNFPSISYFGDENLAISREKVGVVVSVVFLTILTIVFFYAKRDYWKRKYSDYFKKLSSNKTQLPG